MPHGNDKYNATQHNHSTTTLEPAKPTRPTKPHLIVIHSIKHVIQEAFPLQFVTVLVVGGVEGAHRVPPWFGEFQDALQLCPFTLDTIEYLRYLESSQFPSFRKGQGNEAAVILGGIPCGGRGCLC